MGPLIYLITSRSSFSVLWKYRCPSSFRIPFSSSRRSFTLCFFCSSTSVAFFVLSRANEGFISISAVPLYSLFSASSCRLLIRSRSLLSASSYRYGPSGSEHILRASCTRSFASCSSSFTASQSIFIHSVSLNSSRESIL